MLSCVVALFDQGVEPASRRAIYQATAKVLASLHSADFDAIGLGKYGRRENYCKRQVHANLCILASQTIVCLGIMPIIESYSKIS